MYLFVERKRFSFYIWWLKLLKLAWVKKMVSKMSCISLLLFIIKKMVDLRFRILFFRNSIDPFASFRFHGFCLIPWFCIEHFFTMNDAQQSWQNQHNMQIIGGCIEWTSHFNKIRLNLMHMLGIHIELLQSHFGQKTTNNIQFGLQKLLNRCECFIYMRYCIGVRLQWNVTIALCGMKMRTE